jgi:hypothetical protein
MISSNQVNQSIRAALDAEGDDHYGEVEDIVPAINSAKNWVVAVINAALGEKKLGEEIFESIHKSKVVRTSKDSRFSMSILGEDPWTITAIYPNPTVADNGSATPAMPEDSKAYVRTDLYFLDGSDQCKRLSIEEWGVNKGNPFSPGYDGDQLCDGLKRSAYLSPITYLTPEGTPPEKREVTIRPALDRKLVAVFYVDMPADISALGDDDIELPSTVKNLLVDKALHYISFKQTDNTNLHVITSQDMSTLIQAL